MTRAQTGVGVGVGGVPQDADPGDCRLWWLLVNLTQIRNTWGEQTVTEELLDGIVGWAGRRGHLLDW